jgi:hypothetical protein
MRSNYKKLIIYIHRLLLTLALLVGFINVFTYSSFFEKHFFVSPWVFYVTYVAISFIEKIYVNKMKDRGYNIRNIIFLFAGSCIGLIYVILKAIEVFTYTNFIFSNLHINYDLLIYPASILFIEYIFGLNVIDTSQSIVLGLRKLIKIDTIIIPLVLLIFVNNITGIASRMKKDIYFMFTQIMTSKDQIYEFKLGKKFFDFTKFININTSENSKILIPPFPAYPWPQSGNAVYLRYFLDPRMLHSGKEYSSEVDIKSYDYALVAWGETPTTSGNYSHGWPKFDIKAEYILFMNEDGSTTKLSGDYKYASIKDVEKWGIVKIRK